MFTLTTDWSVQMPNMVSLGSGVPEILEILLLLTYNTNGDTKISTISPMEATTPMGDNNHYQRMV
jgi:hypothetical protein